MTSAVLRGTELLGQLLFTPLLAALSIWIGIAISAPVQRPPDRRAAQRARKPPLDPRDHSHRPRQIHVTLGLALGLGAALLLLDTLGWRIVSPAFDRERLLAGTR